MTGMRTRPRHALGNDASLLHAAASAFADEGFDAASMASVSGRAHLTYGAAYARFEDKSAFAVHVFEEDLFPGLQQAIEHAEASLAEGASQFAAALEAFTRPGPGLLASLELIQASQFDPALREGIRQPVAAWLADWIDPTGSPTPSRALVRATLAYLTLGLVLMDGRPWQPDLAGEFARYRAALVAPGSATELPVDRAAHLDVWPFDTGDPRMDRALEAMAQAVGEVGYHRATIGRICRSAGVSAGYLYARYENKRAFFLAANDRLLEYGLSENAAFAERLASAYGPGIAEAVVWREFQRPDLATKRTLALEANRLARYDQQMRQVHDERELALAAQVPQGPGRKAALAYLYSDMAMAFGVYLVPNLLPEIWTLPFDMVTVPLMAGLSV